MKEILLSELVKIQERCGYLKKSEILKLGKRLGMPLSRIYGTASFYSFLQTEKKGKYMIRVCNNLPCMVNGSERILKHLQRILGIKPGETTKDRRFTLETTSCIGCCDRSPAMMINNWVFTDLDKEKVDGIIKRLR